MEPGLLGGHPAIDFLNTTYSPQGIAHEVIGDGESLLRWMVEAGTLDGSTANSIRRRFSRATLDGIAADARKLRDWTTDWIDRWSSRPLDSYHAELRRLNSAMERGHSYGEVVQTKGSMTIVHREHLLDAGELLSLIATQIALLVTHEQAQLVRRCAGSSCTLRFLDRTKAHRRLFCSAAVCGNRAKVAAFRSRQRG